MNSNDIHIETPSGDRVPAYLVRSAIRKSRGAIVLLQEIFGVNANMRSIADDYAADGYDVVVPDLFWRQEEGIQLDPSKPEDRDRATGLMKGLDQSLAVQDALASAEYVRRLSGADNKVGAVGYCLGGKLAYLLATQDGIAAAVSYYGVAIQAALDKADYIQCPLLVHIAQEDHLCPPEAQIAIQQTLNKNQLVTVATYPSVGHAFARRGGGGFNAESAAAADGSTAAFLANAIG